MGHLTCVSHFLQWQWQCPLERVWGPMCKSLGRRRCLIKEFSQSFLASKCYLLVSNLHKKVSGRTLWRCFVVSLSNSAGMSCGRKALDPEKVPGLCVDSLRPHVCSADPSRERVRGGEPCGGFKMCPPIVLPSKDGLHPCPWVTAGLSDLLLIDGISWKLPRHKKHPPCSFPWIT